MTLLHIADLHLGKRVNDFPMLDDQRHILDDILRIAEEERVCGVLIAGDVYDKPVPPTGAVELFDDFLTQLCRLGTAVFVISGNHDSAERIAFGGRLLEKSGVHVSHAYNGEVSPITVTDGDTEADIFLLPFIKPAHVNRCFGEGTVASYSDAVAKAVAEMPASDGRINILVTHQFVTGGVSCDSEELSVGGSDNVDAAVFAPFDYVALGHLHGAQSIGRETVRYSGTPLKYSFSEVAHNKSVTLIDIAAKDDIRVRTRPLSPLRDMFEIKGDYLTVTARSFYEDTPYRDSYMRVTLTDEDDIPDAIGKLRAIYPFIMKLDYDNRRTRENAAVFDSSHVREKRPIELFEELFLQQNNAPMDDAQRAFAEKLIETIWEDET